MSRPRLLAWSAAFLVAASACSTVQAPAGSASNPEAAPSGCPRAWIVTNERASDLSDVDDDAYLPAPRGGVLTAEEAARVAYTMREAPGWCTAHTTEIEHAFRLDPRSETLYWYGSFKEREGDYGDAHAALSRFLRTAAPNDALRTGAEASLARLDKQTAHVGIVCDDRVPLREVFGSDDAGYPMFRGAKPVSCPMRAAVHLRMRSHFAAMVPGCPPIRVTVTEQHRGAVLRLSMR